MVEQTQSAIDEKALKKRKRKTLLRHIKSNWELYIFLVPALAYFILFEYAPMYGLQIAFKNYRAVDGIVGSEWVGMKHFVSFFNTYNFWDLIKNTFLIAFYELIFAFPAPIILALSINQLMSEKYKKFLQTVTYAPHFISTVVMAGMLYLFLSPSSGFVNNLIQFFGGDKIDFLGQAKWFKTVFVGSGIWQTTGWSAIIYLAALTSIDPELHEAAQIDGASKVRRIWHIDIPGILPIIMILMILNIGNFMSIGFQKVLLLQNSLNITSSEVIQTYVYKQGLLRASYSYAAAVGLFNNIINFILLVGMNTLARRMKQESLW